MNSIFVNCLLLYLLVILLSLIQSRFRLFSDNPLSFTLILILMPFLVMGKARGFKTWTGLTGIEIFAYTLVIALMNAKRILPRINEGYIYAYTLFHWYLLYEAIWTRGLNFWTVFVLVISLYPTYLIIKSAFQYKILEKQNKMILYYWFLFSIAFTYADQLALKIVTPVIALHEISFINFLIIIASAIQLYFVSTILALIFVAIPFFHLERSNDKFKIRWHKAMREWRKLLNRELNNYVEYQISFVQAVYITIISFILFYIDTVSEFRFYLIFIYTVVLPIIFFYLKYTPNQNIEKSEV